MANILEQEISRSFKKLNWYGIKVPVAGRQGCSFLMNAPFDFIAVEKGIPYSFEAKMCKENPTSFPLNRMESHQIENLLAFDAARGRPYIVISFRRPKPVAFAILISDWRDISKELQQKPNGRKSIPRKWFDEDPRFVKLPRIKVDSVYVWDLNVLKQ